MSQIRNPRKAKEAYRKIYYSDFTAPRSMHCGWSSDDAQLSAYSAFLGLFDQSGDVLDLGCGNGALLDFLISSLPISICPYGVDFLEESIQEAKEVVLPKFSANFFATSVDEFNPGEKRFKYVITSPDYTFEIDMINYLKKCFEWVEPFGKLILYDYLGSKDFHNYIATWSTLTFGTSEIIETDLSVIICYIKNRY